MQQLTPSALRQWLDDPNRPKPLLLDVREPWEFDHCRIDGSLLVPMRDVPAKFGDLDAQGEVVVICHHGIRSHQVALFLEHYGFTAVYNLQGGVDAWARDVDPAMRKY
ncbi:MAG: rhodanese-like domain-containing protein [Sulfuricellaceae bacterium]|jgi:rhodanese-related sulfurtransferase